MSDCIGCGMNEASKYDNLCEECILAEWRSALSAERLKTAKLEAQNAKLKEALRPFAEACKEAQADGHNFPHGYHDDSAYKAAYDALKEVSGDI